MPAERSMSDIELRIENFAAVFHSYVCKVSSIELGADAKHYRKILYFSLLEALAKARYPTRPPSDAFSCFIVKECGWEDGEKVSLPHLVAFLERTAHPAFMALRLFAYPELRKWSDGARIGIDRDPDKATVQRQWPKDNAGADLKLPELKRDWSACQHRNLLYKYRSKLSHESREPNYSFEAKNDQGPYYEPVSIGKSRNIEWNLAYPSAFLASTCRKGIEGLKIWLLAESKDPYEQFLFGRFLIEELNDPRIVIQNQFA